jgi:hypothetical protein
MSAQYLLTCSCGESLRVVAAQAGEQVGCHCGKLISVPTLRELRKLEPAPPEAGAQRGAAGWNAWNGLIFSGGALFCLAALAGMLYAGVTIFQIEASGATEDATAVINEIEAMQIDELTPEAALTAFDGMRAEGLGHKHEPYWITYRRMAQEQRNLLIASGVCLAVGIVAMVLSSRLRPKSKE